VHSRHHAIQARPLRLKSGHQTRGQSCLVAVESVEEHAAQGGTIDLPEPFDTLACVCLKGSVELIRQIDVDRDKPDAQHGRRGLSIRAAGADWTGFSKADKGARLP